jgi:hypothetical protein
MLVEEQSIATFEAPAMVRQFCIDGRATDAQVFHVRMARSAGRRAAAGVLLRKMYAWRGYAFELAEDAQANKITLYAETSGKLVGTMSVWFDRGAGLPADESFAAQLDLLRAQARRLCEPSRLAIDRGMSKRVFAALIHISYLYAHEVQRYTDYVIEVNPRHVAFYKRMLGFAECGAERDCSRVGAPAVLLRLPLADMGAQIRRWGGVMERHGEERSFYPYFFPVSEEPGMRARLLAGSN